MQIGIDNFQLLDNAEVHLVVSNRVSEHETGIVHRNVRCKRFIFW